MSNKTLLHSWHELLVISQISELCLVSDKIAKFQLLFQRKFRNLDLSTLGAIFVLSKNW